MTKSLSIKSTIVSSGILPYVLYIDTVKECLHVTELTPFILNKLISKIEIGSLEMVNGEKQQVVSVEWKFAKTIQL